MLARAFKKCSHICQHWGLAKTCTPVPFANPIPIGSNFNVQGHFDVEQILVFAELSCHLPLGVSQLIVKLLDGFLQQTESLGAMQGAKGEKCWGSFKFVLEGTPEPCTTPRRAVVLPAGFSRAGAARGNVSRLLGLLVTAVILPILRLMGKEHLPGDRVLVYSYHRVQKSELLFPVLRHDMV